MEIKRAIITAAGRAQTTLPLQTLMDRDGLEKTALRSNAEMSRYGLEHGLVE